MERTSGGRSERGGPLAVAAVAVGICCAAPLLIAALVAGGAGAWLAVTAAPLLGAAFLGAAAVVAIARLRRRT